MADPDAADDWLSADPEPEPEAAPAEAAPAAAAAPEAAPEAAAAQSEELPPPPRARDPNRKLVFRHWVRPTFLSYKYLMDYRNNYYDDVIEYLDKKKRGLQPDIPVPQTWGERMLRTSTRGFSTSNAEEGFKHDEQLLNKITSVVRYHAEHTKDYYSRKYKDILL
ncbi:unnamed protein product [Bemisia tabaci]|uniref:Flightin n=1 Tax=Bemisia tabaci TaxID=7038 RepID=A0A9P0A3G7_BEMTA|nr:unnamed protein product [Bemisia tabaci]